MFSLEIVRLEIWDYTDILIFELKLYKLNQIYIITRGKNA